ncbi:hypothetical protein CEE37_11685 [candidate division LCP-89 bacterium B3_LCP]|uniref:N-acetylmuramoyl-L-alanine amidase n=1 Tax=candidate division LCP-89 bacterium B3_LCP TaxID=2012998 RepID=A0A532UVV8_UNCL8|nr:MAG: hypothetical protein CEE37_11685 [candidate division LCP-89 bacterium B3_LCP]
MILSWNRICLSAFLSLTCLLCGCGVKQLTILEEGNISPQLDVVYPRIAEGDSIFTVQPVDSTFALGSVVPERSSVTVNGVPARVWDNGSFLAYFPLDEENKIYSFEAVTSEGKTSTATIPFEYPDKSTDASCKSYADSINSLLPLRITFVRDHNVVRTSPRRAYWLFPLCGTTALADSFAMPYFRIPLTDDLHGWVEDKFVEIDTSCNKVVKSVLHSISVNANNGRTTVSIPLQERMLFNLIEQPESGSLRLDLFGATARLDQIYYDPKGRIVREIRWNQSSDDLLSLTILLNISKLWGYRTFYHENTLKVEIRNEPKIAGHSLKGRKIVLDAGHGGDNLGAIGPTRLPEKEPNLEIVFALKKLLEKEGAEVILTRENDSTVNIYDRIDYAVDQEAEILLSIHNNALPDGKNPFINRGSAVYYYRPQSRQLAKHLHENLLESSGLDDFGFYYKNLALTRPTELLAVLVECAFIIHPEEEMLLQDDRFIKRVAKGLRNGIKDFLKEYKRQTKNQNRRFSPWFDSYNSRGFNPNKPIGRDGQVHLHVP